MSPPSMFDASPEDIMPPSIEAAPPDERPSSLAWASFEHFVYPTTFALSLIHI